MPLVQRTARAMGMWLAPAYGGELRFAPDLDAVEALAPEREALWARMERTSFLTDDEKRAAVGYGREGVSPAHNGFSLKYRPDQPRDDIGRWVEDGGGDTESEFEPTAGRHPRPPKPHRSKPSTQPAKPSSPATPKPRSQPRADFGAQHREQGPSPNTLANGPPSAILLMNA